MVVHYLKLADNFVVLAVVAVVVGVMAAVALDWMADLVVVPQFVVAVQFLLSRQC